MVINLFSIATEYYTTASTTSISGQLRSSCAGQGNIRLCQMGGSCRQGLGFWYPIVYVHDFMLRASCFVTVSVGRFELSPCHRHSPPCSEITFLCGAQMFRLRAVDLFVLPEPATHLAAHPGNRVQLARKVRETGCFTSLMLLPKVTVGGVGR